MNPLQIAGSILGVALTLGLAGVVWHCWNVTSEYAEFRSGVEKAGKEAKAKADKKEAADKLAKEKADAEAKRLMADNAALARKLRDARARSRELSASSDAASGTPGACVSWPDLLREIGRLDAGLSKLAGEADKDRVDLDVARKWASEVK